MAAAIIGGGAVGDFNGDGVDDIALAFKRDGSHHVDIYVLYGDSAAMSDGVVSMAEIQNPDYAFRIGYTIDAGITGTALDDFELTIKRVGDINGDGLADLTIGMAEDDNGGTFDHDGTFYAVYGQTSGNVAVASLNSAAAGETVLGGIGNSNDTLTQTAAAHTDLVMLGGGGNDTFHLLNANIDRIDGGAGNLDKIFLEAATSIDFSGLNGFHMQRIEGFDLSHGSAQTMTIKLSTIMDMLNSSDTGNLIFFGGANDILKIDTDFGSHRAEVTDGIQNANEVKLALEDVFGNGEVTHEQSGGQDHFTIGGHTISIDSVLITNIAVGENPV